MTDFDSHAGTAGLGEPSSLRPKRLGQQLIQARGKVTELNWGALDYPHVRATVDIKGVELEIPIWSMPASWATRKMTDPQPQVLITVEEILE